MRRITIALSALLLVPAPGRAVDKERLQELLYLPTIGLGLGLRFEPDVGLVLKGAKRDYSSEIAQLRKAMLGDARDAERYHRIARLYSKMDANASAQEAFSHAENLYRERLGQTPNDAALVSALGELLTDFDRSEAGERLLRKAVQLAPCNWQCWVNLGRWLEASALRLSREAEHGSRSANDAPPVIQASDAWTPDTMSRARSLLNEAGACFDKAVACGPSQARTYRERYTFRMVEGRVFQALHIPREHVDETSPSLPQFIAADCRRAADLEPTNLVDVFFAMSMDLSDTAVHFEDGNGWKGLPDDVRSRLQQNLKRIERLTHSDDRMTAVGAHLALATMSRAVFGDKRDSERHCRSALALDPALDAPWEMLLGMLEDSKSYDVCLSVALDWLKHSESARKHYVVALCYEGLKQWRMAEDHLRSVLRSQPNDARATVAMGVLRMKQSVRESSLAEAYTYFTKATKLMNDDTPQDLRLDCAVTMGIYWALKGDVEQARSLLNAVRQKDPKRKTPGKALEALN